MKTIQAAIVSIAALSLSGCASGYYQRGYVGNGSRYSSPGYYQSYERSYVSPGTSITYSRDYLQPNYRREYDRDNHRDWHNQKQDFDRYERGRGSWQNRDFGGRDFGRDYSTRRDPRLEQSASEQRQRGFGWGGREYRQRGGSGGRRDRQDD